MMEDDFQIHLVTLLLGFEMMVWDRFLLTKDERRETLLSHINAEGVIEKERAGHESWEEKASAHLNNHAEKVPHVAALCHTIVLFGGGGEESSDVCKLSEWETACSKHSAVWENSLWDGFKCYILIIHLCFLNSLKIKRS